MALIDKVGLLYFLSMTLMCVLITFDTSSGSVPMSYIVISNAAFLCLFVPTLIITVYYVYYRILKYRLY